MSLFGPGAKNLAMPLRLHAEVLTRDLCSTKQIADHSTGSCGVTSVITGRREKYETHPTYVAMRLNTSSPPSRPRHLPVKVKVTLQQATKPQKWSRGTAVLFI